MTGDRDLPFLIGCGVCMLAALLICVGNCSESSAREATCGSHCRAMGHADGFYRANTDGTLGGRCVCLDEVEP